MATSAYGNPYPRLIVTPQTSPTSQAAPSTGKTLALVGPFTFLDPSRVYTVTSAAALKALNPASTDLQLFERLIYNCAPAEPQARNKPAAVYLVNSVGGDSTPSTAASAILYDAVPAAALDITANLFGALGNRTTITVADGTTQGKKYTIACPGVPTETYDNVGGQNVITVGYDDTEASTMLMAYDQSTGLRISYTKTGIAVGTYTPSKMAFDGTITITPSAAPVGGAYTVTVSGINKATGLSDSEVRTWPDGGGAGAQTTAKSWSSVTSIVFANTAGGSPTISIAGYAFDLTPGVQYPTAKSFADRINQFSSADFTATIGSANAGTLDSTLLDSFSSSTIRQTTKSLTANVNAAVLAMAGSFLVTVERSTGADGAPANGTTLLGGGSDGTQTAAGWQDALELLKSKQVNHLWMDTDNATSQGYGFEHIVECEGIGQLYRQLWVGATANESLTALQTRVLAFNSQLVCLWYQEFNRTSPAGVATWYAPKYLALQEAALRCAMPVGEPSTMKRPNVLDYRSSATTNADLYGTDLINAGICFVQTVVNQGVMNIRPVTTYGLSDNVFYCEPGSVESFGMSVNAVNNAVASARALGSADTRFTSQDFAAIVSRSLNLQLSGATRFIKAWDPSSLVIEVVNTDWYRATYNVQPISGVNFIETLPTATVFAAAA